MGSTTWTGRSFDLGRMTLPELLRAYAGHHAIKVYGLLAIVSAAVAIIFAKDTLRTVLAALAVPLVYPFVEYLIHRFLLHNRALYRSPAFAKTWKRIHYDHHQDPNRLDVLFGALWTTLPTIVIVTMPLGYIIGGLPGCAAAFSAGLVMISFYELCHCFHHLNYMPRSSVVRRIKQLHLAHHFHNERGNFGIMFSVIDHLFGTFYGSPQAVSRSPTTFNLGYHLTEAARYPWVAELTGSPPRDRPPPAVSRGA